MNGRIIFNKKVWLTAVAAVFVVWALFGRSTHLNEIFLSPYSSINNNRHQQFEKRHFFVQVDVSFDELVNNGRPEIEVINQTASNGTKEDVREELSAATIIPVLALACNRPAAILAHLEQLIRFRKNFTDGDTRFPIIVSLDCNDGMTKAAVLSFGNAVHVMEQPDQSRYRFTSQRELMNIGYYKIARHYKWALDQIFLVFNYSAVIVTEDDLNVAPDFFEYFAATYPLLVKDKSLWCVSAWNDNSKSQLILKDRPELLHRTDFFPGLGWMMRRDLWLELSPKFPNVTWDDWMRNPEQRKDRACIRPEISRTTTFGRNGVSRGQFFDVHLSHMKLNTKFVPFTQLNLSYLEKGNYDRLLRENIDNATEVTVQTLYSNNDQTSGVTGPLRVNYLSNGDLCLIAKWLNAMADFKSGVMRTAYQGVVSLVWQNRRLFLVPPEHWTGYHDKFTP